MSWALTTTLATTLLLQADATRFKPVNFDQLVEELAGALIQIAELATFVLVKLNIGRLHQHLAGQHARLVMGNLPAFSRNFRQPVSGRKNLPDNSGDSRAPRAVGGRAGIEVTIRVS